MLKQVSTLRGLREQDRSSTSLQAIWHLGNWCFAWDLLLFSKSNQKDYTRSYTQWRMPTSSEISRGGQENYHKFTSWFILHIKFQAKCKLKKTLSQNQKHQKQLFKTKNPTQFISLIKAPLTHKTSKMSNSEGHMWLSICLLISYQSVINITWDNTTPLIMKSYSYSARGWDFPNPRLPVYSASRQGWTVPPRPL